MGRRRTLGGRRFEKVEGGRMSFELKIMCGFVLVLLLLYVPPILYFKKGFFKRFYHDFMGWHQPKDIRWHDGISEHAQCKYCGKDIMQDSQGNWF